MTGLRLPIAGSAALAAILGFAGGAQAEPKVVVTIKPIHSLVARVMEGVGAPTVLVGGTASPHSYAMKPSDAKALNEADVFFRVGEAIEPFTRKIVTSLSESVHVSTLVEAPGVKLLDARGGGDFEAHGDHAEDGHDDHGHEKEAKKAPDDEHDKKGKKAKHEDDDHDKEAAHEHGETGGRDHHVWLDPENAKAMVTEIARVLAEKAPEHAGRLTENARKLNAELDVLAAELGADLKPIAGKPFVVFHDAYQYFERRFGLDAVGSITVVPDTQPSAKRLSAIRKKIRKLGPLCVFAEPQYEPKLLAAVIEGSKSRTGTLDPEGLGIEPGPDAYFKLMRGLSDGLKNCLQQSS